MMARPIDEVQLKHFIEALRLLFFEDPSDFKKWNIIVEPVRREPDPALLEEMLAVQLSDPAKDLLIRWGK